MSKTAVSTTARPEVTPSEGVESVFPLPRALEALGALRHHVRTTLAGWGVPAGTADDALLVISEMTTNAVTHAFPPAVLRLSCTHTDGCSALRVEVTDAGPTPQAERGEHGRQPEEHGRGTAIIAALSARCGICVHSDGTTRWAELPAA
ncbi:ATP-binding protein [Streptomyces malaysiensis]|uniref:ATP-binding protein n=1 Tax=Streptomyces malaysiensis TaxID=92644 RepID=UPI00142EB28D|nr:ATP-binding protein [Streptomyces malaysiensis]